MRKLTDGKCLLHHERKLNLFSQSSFLAFVSDSSVYMTTDMSDLKEPILNVYMSMLTLQIKSSKIAKTLWLF